VDNIELIFSVKSKIFFKNIFKTAEFFWRKDVLAVTNEALFLEILNFLETKVVT
jgi:hypothetical protein